MKTDERIRVLTNSEIQTLKTCPRQWWLRYYKKLSLIREDPHGPRSLGTRVHGALAVYYKDESNDSLTASMKYLAAGIAKDLKKVEGDAAQVKKVTDEGALATIMMDGYFEWLEEEGADAYIEIVGQEEERRIPLGYAATGESANTELHRPIHLIAKLDTRILDHNHSVPVRKFMDHKTVMTFADKLKTLHLDEQMQLYHLIEYLILLGEEEEDAQKARTDGALYNMLRKVKRTSKAKPPFYARHEVRHNLQQLRNFWTRTAGVAQRLVELEARLDAGGDHHFVCPPAPTRDCSWQCDFFQICPMFDDGSDVQSVIETQFEIKHPLAGRYTAVWSEDEKETT